MFVYLLLLAVSACLRAAPADGAAAPLLTFLDRDPITGAPVRCDRCPPGTYLRSRCSSTRRSVCEPCPEGSFTELWNHVEHCLRCRACGSRQVEKAACTAQSDCQCECESGFYFRPEHGGCVRHSACPPGHGVVAAGTPDRDTVCQVCSNNTFSDVSSAHLGCEPQQNCSAGGMQQLLRGSCWHDSVCGDCRQRRDGALYLKQILPAVLLHHQLSAKQLRRVVNKLPAAAGRKQGGVAQPDAAQLLRRIGAWLESAPSHRIRELPAILSRAGAGLAAEWLQVKLRNIDEALEACGPENADPTSGTPS